MEINPEIINTLDPTNKWEFLKEVLKNNEAFFLKKGFDILTILKNGLKDGTIEEGPVEIMWGKAIERYAPEKNEENIFLEMLYENERDTFNEILGEIHLTLDVFQRYEILANDYSEDNWRLAYLLYTDFEQSKFNDFDQPLYECVVDYSESNRPNKVFRSVGMTV